MLSIWTHVMQMLLTTFIKKNVKSIAQVIAQGFPHNIHTIMRFC